MRADDLFMVALDLDPRRLATFGRAARVLQREEADLGYLGHAWLSATFGDAAPRPFSVEVEQGGRTRLVAYSTHPALALQQRASEVADPLAWEVARWDTLASREIPVLSAGRVVPFRARVCPTVRRSGRSDPDGSGEVDAFLREVQEQAPAASEMLRRGEVYGGWLRDELARRGGGELVEAQIVHFQLSRLLRRDHQPVRSAHHPRLPDCTLAGQVRITDGHAFRELLRRGLGRHRAFGFGMVLLGAGRG